MCSFHQLQTKYGNEKCKQHSNWLELELSTADRVIPTRETK